MNFYIGENVGVKCKFTEDNGSPADTTKFSIDVLLYTPNGKAILLSNRNTKDRDIELLTDPLDTSIVHGEIPVRISKKMSPGELTAEVRISTKGNTDMVAIGKAATITAISNKISKYELYES